jgi:hypothetical protein
VYSFRVKYALFNFKLNWNKLTYFSKYYVQFFQRLRNCYIQTDRQTHRYDAANRSVLAICHSQLANRFSLNKFWTRILHEYYIASFININLPDQYYVTWEYNVHTKLREAADRVQCSTVQCSHIMLGHCVYIKTEREEPLPWQNSTSKSERFRLVGEDLQDHFLQCP